jgi:outer membrane PBP1 activator LpoA protein
MAAIHLDMAREVLSLGKIDDAGSLLKLADEAHLDEAGRTDKRLLGCWLLVEQGKTADAETRLRAADDGALSPAQAAWRRELLAEACLARKATAAAIEVCGDAAEMAAWRLAAEAEDLLRAGDRAGAEDRVARARAAAGPRAPWLTRRLDRLLRERK